MSKEAWKKIEQIFHAALDLPVEKRSEYLQLECAGDAALFFEVQSLLNNFEQNKDILEEPAFELCLEAINDKPQKNLSSSEIGYYKLEKKIGAGGMGEVYKALDTRLNRSVALKFLSESLENDQAAKRRLTKEAQAVAMLDHPNICAVYGIEHIDEHHFIVMQYIEGTTLAESIDRKNITVEEFKSIARQIITAVDFAHSHGVIHRDLKPGNIMITKGRQIKVLDFGLAKIIPQNNIFGSSPLDESRLSQNGLVIGTVSYMSPEQLRGEKIDYQTDIFSVGIILYELIAGENPFNYKSQAETIAAILSNPPRDLKKISPEFPNFLINIIGKCLQKNKADRFQSTAEILVELDKIESSSIRHMVSKRSQDRFVKIAFMVIVLFVIMASIFFYLTKPNPKTVAVLPITFADQQAEKKYLAEDLTQSVIDKLSKLSDLKVKNGTLVNQYLTSRFKGQNIELKTAGEELKADVVFSGVIRNREDGPVLETRIINTLDGTLIDSNDLKFDENNLLELTEDVATRITTKIDPRVDSYDKTELTKKETESSVAKSHYQKGRVYLKQRKNSEALQKAIQEFTTAKDIDAKYTKAWAGLAEAYILQSIPGIKNLIPPKEAFRSAKAAANKAIDLDNTLPDPYSSLGLISYNYDWDWTEAERSFRTAIARDPEFIPAHVGLVNVLRLQGRFDEAVEEINKVKQLDPLSVSAETQLASVYYRKRDFRQVEELLSRLFQKDPDDVRINYHRVYLYLSTQRFNEAINILEPLYKVDKILSAAPLGFAYAKMGRRDEAVKIIEELERLGKEGYVPKQEAALIYVGLGNYDKVFEYLHQSCEERFAALPGWIGDPVVDEVKSDPRFTEIKKCVNL